MAIPKELQSFQQDLKEAGETPVTFERRFPPSTNPDKLQDTIDILESLTEGKGAMQRVNGGDLKLFMIVPKRNEALTGRSIVLIGGLGGG